MGSISGVAKKVSKGSWIGTKAKSSFIRKLPPTFAFLPQHLVPRNPWSSDTAVAL